jgi:hypothetical protein
LLADALFGFLFAPENSAATIQSAGIGVKKTPVKKPRVFAATQGAVSGTASRSLPKARSRDR